MTEKFDLNFLSCSSSFLIFCWIPFAGTDFQHFQWYSTYSYQQHLSGSLNCCSLGCDLTILQTRCFPCRFSVHFLNCYLKWGCFLRNYFGCEQICFIWYFRSKIMKNLNLCLHSLDLYKMDFLQNLFALRRIRYWRILSLPFRWWSYLKLLLIWYRYQPTTSGWLFCTGPKTLHQCYTVK